VIGPFALLKLTICAKPEELLTGYPADPTNESGPL
jgi:hypothetical protein